MSIGGHQSQRAITTTWLTPPEILAPLGKFDLDPCTPIDLPWNTAENRFSGSGLQNDWKGRVWCNPPYGKEIRDWMIRMRDHNNGIALVFARTETAWFFESVWNHATAILFIEGRLHFHLPDGTRAKGNAGAPSVLIAYGQENAEILRNCGIKGKFIYIPSK